MTRYNARSGKGPAPPDRQACHCVCAVDLKPFLGMACASTEAQGCALAFALGRGLDVGERSAMVCTNIGSSCAEPGAKGQRSQQVSPIDGDAFTVSMYDYMYNRIASIPGRIVEVTINEKSSTVSYPPHDFHICRFHSFHDVMSVCRRYPRAAAPVPSVS
jgi:hypothetical protein